MKRYLFLLFVVLFFLACEKEKDVDEVVVYAYSSFTGEWGLGPKVAKMFEEKTGTSIRFITCKDSGAFLTHAVREKAKPKADVVLGIDNYLLSKALKADILLPYKPSRIDEIDSEFLIDPQYHLIPFDFGYFAFMYNTSSNISAPKSLNDLMDAKYKGKIVLMNPMTSTPGLGFLLWLHSVYGEEYLNVWKKINGNVLSMPTSWSQGYALFSSGEVPLVISYTTSLAAHVLYDKTDKFQPLIFDEGHVVQLEGMGILKGAKHEEKAKEFIEFMLSDEVQKLIPETQFMFPIIKKTTLPESFANIPSPSKILEFNGDDLETIIDSAMNVLK
ncbi:MAG: thiamine ABC transporter substrate-binding protein [Treponema sp.]